MQSHSDHSGSCPESHPLSCCFSQNGCKEMVPLTLVLIQCLPPSVIPTLCTVVAFFQHEYTPTWALKVLDQKVNQQLRDMKIGLVSGQVLRTAWLMQGGTVSPPQFKQQKPLRIIFKPPFKLHWNSHFLCSVTSFFVCHWNLTLCS